MNPHQEALEYSKQSLDYVNNAVSSAQLNRNYIWKDPSQYRTTYIDLCDQTPKEVRSSFPSGYGGHKPECRAKALYLSLDPQSEEYGVLNEERDYIPPFEKILSGVPSITKNTLCKKANPSFGTIPTTNKLITPPFATTAPLNDPPNHRNSAYTVSNYLYGKASCQSQHDPNLLLPIETLNTPSLHTDTVGSRTHNMEYIGALRDHRATMESAVCGRQKMEYVGEQKEEKEEREEGEKTMTILKDAVNPSPKAMSFEETQRVHHALKTNNLTQISSHYTNAFLLNELQK